jgi:elongation factor 1 alpha-like protein
MKEPTKIKHKNLDVLKEFEKANIKNSASFVVIGIGLPNFWVLEHLFANLDSGHVDHGKSTLMGRLLYDLKVIDERTMEKLRRESHKIGKASFALAWVMDATSDERARGVTVDTATSFFETEKTKFTILDAPGHQDFIPNMIAGASQADFAVLVIDAGTNSFESGLRGQTKEHALLVRSMAVQRLIVAINKMDKVDWSQERFTEIEQQMSAFLMSANFSPKTISFIPCAGLTGENILTAPTSATASWYKGPTLVQELDNAEPTKRALQRPLRLTISEVYRGTGTSASTVSVAGRLDSGSLQVGDTVQIQPSAETAVIKSVEADNRAADWAVAGQIVSLNIGGIDPAHVRHGDIVCHPQDVVKNVKSFKAKILTFDHVMPMFVTVHRGPLHAPGKIAKLVATLDKSSGEIVKKGPRVVQPGSVARVLVELENDMPLEAGWRVVLRADGTSLAAGLVE